MLFLARPFEFDEGQRYDHPLERIDQLNDPFHLVNYRLQLKGEHERFNGESKEADEHP